MARILFLLLVLFPLSATAASVNGIRTWAGPDETRVVFDLSDTVEHTLFKLDNPPRVVLDFKSTRMDPALVQGKGPTGLVQKIRSGARDGNVLRVVLDLSDDARAQSFMLRPSGSYGYRLVVDLEQEGRATAPVKRAAKPEARPLIIAIDAGHGGEDPGAIGPGGTYEKHIVLDVAKKLAHLIEQEPGMEPLLIRTGDYYVGLRARREKAREHGADIFISLHADAVPARSARGGSVYTLSRNGASTEAARLLAQRENSADLIGGVSLDDKEDLVATVLLDLSRAANTESSMQLASAMLKQLGTVGRLHKTSVEQAGFAVLKSLDMPSVLVELAFISNPQEEALLKNSSHQWKLARAILSGVLDYRNRYMPAAARYAGTATREHVVRRGDTLSGIAQSYDVSLDVLRAANGLAGDHITVGTKLRIP